jgi:hypothetical protein
MYPIIAARRERAKRESGKFETLFKNAVEKQRVSDEIALPEPPRLHQHSPQPF